MDARVWFQKFLDDGVEHEYLCTEGYIWTESYPEAKRILEQGNNQSMELNENLQGSWTTDDNGTPQFFIISEALIEKLCILGEDVEPCFEGASISKQFSLSLDENFKQQLFAMIKELKEALGEGGTSQMDIDQITMEEDSEFKKKSEEEEKKDEKEQEDTPKNEEKQEDKTEQEVTPKNEEKQGEKKSDEEDDDEKKKKKYILEEIPEYMELSKNFANLQKDYESLQEEVMALRSFKASAERTAKEEMIKGFYMLSDDDKKDCLDNIDTYSLDEIEAKLSIICVRNKVNFNLDEDKTPENPTIYTLGDNDDGDSAPAWIKAVRNTAKEMN